MKIEKVKKLLANIDDKTEYVIYIRNLKQALNHGLVLKKLHRIIEFKEKAWLKSCIDMNTNLRKKGKMLLKKKLSWWIFWKNYGECEETEILNFSQHKEQETVWC